MILFCCASELAPPLDMINDFVLLPEDLARRGFKRYRSYFILLLLLLLLLLKSSRRR